MRFLIGLVIILALFSLEAVIFTAGYHFGSVQGFEKGYNAAVQDERDSRISFVLDRMAYYESTYRTTVWGDFDGTRHLAYGLYQFHRPTFVRLARMSGNPKLNWKNPEHQYIVAKWAIQNGYGGLWTTYRRALHDYFISGRFENGATISMR